MRMFVLLFCLFSPQVWGTEGLREYKIKAGYIYNFLIYTRYPVVNNPLVLCTPDSEFIDIAKAVIETEPNGSPSMSLKLVESDFSECDALFVSAGYTQWWHEALGGEIVKHMLVIGEQHNFTELGAQINFIQLGSKIRFEINLENLRFAELSMSLNVLRLAKVVGED